MYLLTSCVCTYWHHLYAPIDIICMYLLTLYVCTYWHHLYVPTDIICMYLLTSSVCTNWHHLYVPTDIICMYLLTSSVCTHWHHLFVLIDTICMYLLTSSVCTYWHHLSFDPLNHSPRQQSFLLIFSHSKNYPFFPVLIIAITFVEFLLNLLISPSCYTAPSNFCHSNWHPIFPFHVLVALTCLP